MAGLRCHRLLVTTPCLDEALVFISASASTSCARASGKIRSPLTPVPRTAFPSATRPTTAPPTWPTTPSRLTLALASGHRRLPQRPWKNRHRRRLEFCHGRPHGPAACRSACSVSSAWAESNRDRAARQAALGMAVDALRSLSAGPAPNLALAWSARLGGLDELLGNQPTW